MINFVTDGFLRHTIDGFLHLEIVLSPVQSSKAATQSLGHFGLASSATNNFGDRQGDIQQSTFKLTYEILKVMKHNRLGMVSKLQLEATVP